MYGRLEMQTRQDIYTRQAPEAVARVRYSGTLNSTMSETAPKCNMIRCLKRYCYRALLLQQEQDPRQRSEDARAVGSRSSPVEAVVRTRDGLGVGLDIEFRDSGALIRLKRSRRPTSSP